MNKLPTTLLLRCFLRTYAVVGCSNPRGMYNIGFIHALEPALAALYEENSALTEARLRHARYFNCHPFFTPLYLGISIHAETAIAAHKVQAASLGPIQTTMSNSLSALGDSFFGGSVQVCWALSCAGLVLSGYTVLAGLFSVLLCVLLQVLRYAGFLLGLRKGMSTLILLRRYNLINWGDRIKQANGFLLAFFFWCILGPEQAAAGWVIGCLLFALGWCTRVLRLPRALLAMGLLLLMGEASHLDSLFGAQWHSWFW